MPNIGEISDLKVAVSTSTAKNSYKAGREIAKRILQKINCNPDIIFLFCTMDYDEKEYGGLTEILKGVWEVLPENIKLVGGTVPGFLNTDGCYARGVTALAISYPNMNISIGFGKNTKRNPKKAANQAVKTIKTNLKNEYKNKMIFSIISGTKNPDLPGVENTSVITSKIKSKIMLSMFSFFQKAFQLGFGREHELLEEVIKQLPEYSIIHSSSYSLPPFSKNFQFFNKQVLDECAVIVAIDTDMDFDIDFRTGAKKIIDSKITKISKDQTVVKKLNYNPPLDEYIKKLGWNYDIQVDRYRIKISIWILQKQSSYNKKPDINTWTIPWFFIKNRRKRCFSNKTYARFNAICSR